MPQNHAFLDLPGPMARKVAAYDWATTPLGPIAGWPAALRTAVGLTLRSGFAKCLCWGPELTAIYNDAFVPILGDKGNCLGQSFAVIWAEAWHDIGPIAEQAMLGHATFIKDHPLTVNRGDAGPEEAFFTFSYSPVVDENGIIRGFMDTVMETTDTVRFARSAAIRNTELLHRMKNSYALISAVVNQTARTAADKDELRLKLLDRLTAMAQAQEILSVRKRSHASVAEIVQGAAERFEQMDISRFRTNGPDVALSDEETFALSLALYELATNSTKYGALSVETGKVHVDWTSGPEEFQFTWRETGGPPVAAPRTRGFGTFLIRRALAAEFDGDVQLDYAPDGLVCTLRSPAMRRTG